MNEIKYIVFGVIAFVLYEDVRNWVAIDIAEETSSGTSIELQCNLSRILEGSPNAEANGVKYFRMGRIVPKVEPFTAFSKCKCDNDCGCITFDHTSNNVWYAFNTETRELREVDDCNTLNLLNMIK